jgi:hypothetical protein
MKLTIDFENKDVPKTSFKAFKEMLEILFKETSFEYKNYNLVNDSIEDFAGTQFALERMKNSLEK